MLTRIPSRCLGQETVQALLWATFDNLEVRVRLLRAKCCFVAIEDDGERLELAVWTMSCFLSFYYFSGCWGRFVVPVICNAQAGKN